MEFQDDTDKDEKSRKNKLEKLMATSINNIIRTFQECPMFYLNEEDIRCDLYRNVLNEYPHEIWVKNLYNNVYRSSAVHADVIVKNPEEKFNPKKPKPDLIVYYAGNTEKNQICIGNVRSKSKSEKIHFYAYSKDENNKKRVIVQIKFTGHSKQISDNKIIGIENDLKKLSEWETWKKYMLYFDRSNQWNDRIINLDENGNFLKKKDMKKGDFYKKIKLEDYMINYMKKLSEKKDGDIEFYYLGIPSKKSEKKEQKYHYINGTKIKD